jgi:hypothetical protein
MACCELDWGGTMGLGSDTNLPKLAAPARRALAQAGYVSLEQLAGIKEADLTQPHGIGSTAVDGLRRALQDQGLSFKT